MTSERIPPHSWDSEVCVLGSMILDIDCVPAVMENVTEKDFYRKDNQKIYKAICEVYQNNNAIDPVMVKNRLIDNKDWEIAGGAEYLTRIMNSVPTTCNAEHYAKTVRLLSHKRRLISMGAAIINDGYDSGTELNDIIDKIKNTLPESNIQKDEFENCSMVSGLKTLHEHLERMRNGANQIVPLPWVTLAEAFGGEGIPVGDIGLLVSLSGSGKTWMAYQMAITATDREQPLPTYIINTEMSAKGYMGRIIALLTGNALAATPGNKDYMDEIAKSAEQVKEKLEAMPIEITDSGEYNTKSIENLIQQKAEKGYKLIILDHLGEIDTRGRKEYIEFPSFAKRLRDIARANDTVILIVSHLRKSEDGGVELAYCKRLRTIVDFMLLLKTIPEKTVEIYGACGPEMRTVNRLLIVDKIRDAADGYVIGFNFDSAILQMKDCGRVRK